MLFELLLSAQHNHNKTTEAVCLKWIVYCFFFSNLNYTLKSSNYSSRASVGGGGDNVGLRRTSNQTAQAGPVQRKLFFHSLCARVCVCFYVFNGMMWVSVLFLRFFWNGCSVCTELWTAPGSWRNLKWWFAQRLPVHGHTQNSSALPSNNSAQKHRDWLLGWLCGQIGLAHKQTSPHPLLLHRLSIYCVACLKNNNNKNK